MSIALWGGLASAFGIKEANRQNSHEARNQQTFQEKQTGTAYGRAMADMRDAGLNPILASKLGPASSASGAMANMQNIPGGGIQSAASAQGIAKQEQEIKSEKANTLIKESEAIIKGTEVTGAKRKELIETYIMKIHKYLKETVDAPWKLKQKLIQLAIDLAHEKRLKTWKKEIPKGSLWDQSHNKGKEPTSGLRPPQYQYPKGGSTQND